jgi:hypothetical protein
MARFDHPLLDRPPVPAHRRRATWAVILTVAFVSVLALFALPAIADATPVERGDSGLVFVCTAGIVDLGDIQTSAASATRLADGAPIPYAAGCTVE